MTRRRDNNSKLSSTEANSVLTKPEVSRTLRGNGNERYGPTMIAIAAPSQLNSVHLDHTNNSVLASSAAKALVFPSLPAKTDPARKLLDNFMESEQSGYLLATGDTASPYTNPVRN